MTTEQNGSLQDVEQQPECPCFPLEIFGEIASFVAGANEFGTLASLRKTSKTMAQELKGILYETVVWNDALLRRLRENYAVGECPDEFQHIKFILGVEPGWDSERPLDDTRFPNLRSKMIQELDPGSEFLEDDVPPLHTIGLKVLRNTSLATISSIIRYPLDWNFLDRVASRSRVLGITSVGIFNRATLTLGNPDGDGLFIPITSSIRSAFVSRCTQYGAVEPERTETCIRTLLQLLMSSASLEHASWMDYGLRIQCDDLEDARIWLQQLPSWFDINSNIEPTFKLFFESALTSRQFLGLAQGFCDMFEEMWTRGIPPRNAQFELDDEGDDDNARERVFCQITSFPPGNDADEQYIASFIEYIDRDGFKILIEEYPPFPPPIEGSRESPVRDSVVLMDRFFTPLDRMLRRPSYDSYDLYDSEEESQRYRA